MSDDRELMTFAPMPDDGGVAWADKLNQNMRALVARAFGVPESLFATEGPRKSTHDIMTDLACLMDVLDAHPIAQAIWFIDCNDEYHRLVSHVLCCFQPPRPDERYRPNFMGVPVYRWDSVDILTRITYLLSVGRSIEWARNIYPFCQPGVWVQMSDGKHRRLVL